MKSKMVQKIHGSINHEGREIPIVYPDGSAWLVCPVCDAKRELK